MNNIKKINDFEKQALIKTLETRFLDNISRHANIKFEDILKKIENNNGLLQTLLNMEQTGGEPDVIVLNDELVFVDCSKESPIDRRSLCYDNEALEKRKTNKPAGSAISMANEIGIELLTEEQYRELQKYGEFDIKTSSWIKTPNNIRDLGGSLFCDRRYDAVFVYHNGADSYYSARGFRGYIKI